jgi:hypothetical protein
MRMYCIGKGEFLEKDLRYLISNRFFNLHKFSFKTKQIIIKRDVFPWDFKK